MKIRPATPEDASLVWKVHVDAIADLCSKDYTDEQIEAWIQPKKPDQYLRPISEGRLFVAEKAGQVVGFGEYAIEEEGEISAVYVSPDFTRQGVGRGIFQRLINELSKRGISRARLAASKNSVPFYIAMGCSRAACEGQAVTLRGGVKLECIRMTLPIKTEQNKSAQAIP